MCRGRPDWILGIVTPNMWRMFVTLDVSRLSVWLNADACCRVERREYKVGDVRRGDGRGLVGRKRCGMAGADRTENMLTMFKTLDVSRLSGWLNADACCRVERRARGEARQEVRRLGGGATAAQAICRRRDPTVRTRAPSSAPKA